MVKVVTRYRRDLDTGVPCALVSKPVDGLIGATFRLEGYSNAWVDGIKVKVQLKIGIFKQALCEVIGLLYLSVSWKKLLCYT